MDSSNRKEIGLKFMIFCFWKAKAKMKTNKHAKGTIMTFTKHFKTAGDSF